MSITFLQFTLVICGAALLSFVFRVLKQPDVLAFLVLGGFLGLFGGVLGIESFHFFEFFSDLGLTFLLFLIGLELSTGEIKHLGRPLVFLSIGQVLITTLVGYGLGKILLGSSTEALYFSLALTFSSTVIVLKLLTKRGETQTLFGRLGIGVLVVQDLVAVLSLIALTSYVPGVSFSPVSLLWPFAKATLLFALVFVFSQHFFPRIFSRLAKDSEALFLWGLAWALGLAAFVASPIMGFSVEIGGFLAGLSLANSAQHHQIAARIRPLRDLFILIFFIYLGTHLDFSLSLPALGLVFWLLVATLIIKPLLVMTLMGLLGHRKRTSFLVAVSLGQMSEFSLILATLGLKLGHLNKEFLGVVTLAATLSMAISTFMIHHSATFYRIVGSWLSIFERRRSDALALGTQKLRNHVVLVGCGRKGIPVLASLLKSKQPVLVVDTDPKVVAGLPRNVHFLYGDITDEEIQERADLGKARVVISTAMSLAEDMAILSFFKHKQHKAKVIVSARNEYEAAELYKAGAHYVLLPDRIAGQFLGNLLAGKKDFIRVLEKMKGTSQMAKVKRQSTG